MLQPIWEVAPLELQDLGETRRVGDAEFDALVPYSPVHAGWGHIVA
jgi:hypothetical protein